MLGLKRSIALGAPWVGLFLPCTLGAWLLPFCPLPPLLKRQATNGKVAGPEPLGASGDSSQVLLPCATSCLALQSLQFT